MDWICGNLADYRGLLGSGCIGVEDGFIRSVRKAPGRGRVRDYTGTGYIVSPGLIDIHVHLRGLEYSYKETEETGGRAAAASGITLVIDMPNTLPRADNRETVRAKLEALSRAPVDHGLFAAIPRDPRRVEELLSEAIAGFKVYPEDLYERSGGVKGALSSGSLVVLHPELPEAGSAVAEDLVSREAHRNCGFEAAAVEVLAGMGGGRVHVTHASCRSTIIAAKKHGYTVDVTPHHLFYNTLTGAGCMYRVNPPLRPWHEPSWLVYMLLEGLVDAFASDHAPHALWEKSDPLYCSPGIPWLESWPWLVYRLVSVGALDLSEFLWLASRGPAVVAGLEDYGVIREGARGNILVYDPRAVWRFPGPAYSMARHYPSTMARMAGRPIEVLVGGETVFIGGEVIEGVRGVNPFTWRRP
ncbi:MAG: dihydroorotase [Desulfurococcales archaeon]|nr:dihydroorotase [Desulfurococcales archaeon]